MDYQAIIDHFYGTADSELKCLLMVHSRAVADKALRICDGHPELHLDCGFVEAAAMLHDIGIIQCDAPGIFCHGSQPYICHGIMGAKMIHEYSGLSEPSDWLDAIARVCQRHTGAGITRAEIMEQQLPLPLSDDGSEPYMPETMEEKLVCYADKFFSKTRLDQEKSLEHVERSLAKFGDAGLIRFGRWREIFR